MLPTLIVSLFSMNMPLPLPRQETLLPFWIVLFLAATSIIVVLLAWRLRKW
jgi:Mg2+ and Co2+ transporter CorA